MFWLSVVLLAERRAELCFTNEAIELANETMVQVGLAERGVSYLPVKDSKVLYSELCLCTCCYRQYEHSTTLLVRVAEQKKQEHFRMKLINF